MKIMLHASVLNIKPDMDANSCDGGRNNIHSKYNENNATCFGLNIKPDMEANSWDNGTNNIIHSKYNENNATCCGLSIKPDMDANSCDGGRNNTNYKDSDDIAVKGELLKVKHDVDSIDVTVVEKENNSQTSSIKSEIGLNYNYANYGTASATKSSVISIKDGDVKQPNKSSGDRRETLQV